MFNSVNSADLKQSLERIDTLPAMPVIAKRMLALRLDTDEGEAQLLKLIAQDPQISARIIGLSNASLFGSPGIISSINDAAMRLGLAQIKSVAIGMATLSAFAQPTEGKLKSADLWTHSITIASAMRAVAKRMPAQKRPVDEQIFLAGLLHDIGYNALNFIAKDLSDTLHTRLNTAPTTTSLLKIEHELLGMHHGEIGAKLGAHWGLPAEIIAVIRHHHAPENADAEVGYLLVRLVNIVEKLLTNFAINELTAAEITAQEWMDLGIAPNEADSISEEIAIVATRSMQLANAA